MDSSAINEILSNGIPLYMYDIYMYIYICIHLIYMTLVRPNHNNITYYKLGAKNFSYTHRTQKDWWYDGVYEPIDAKIVGLKFEAW